MELADGSRLRVKAGGLLLGRGRDCDVRVLEPRASSRHALIRMGAKALEIVHLGQNPTLTDGSPCAPGRIIPLQDGSTVQIPGLSARVDVDQTDEFETVGWAIATDKETLHPVNFSPFLVGGGDHDDLILPGLPPGVLTLTLSQGALYFWSSLDVTLDGRSVPSGECQPLQPGWSILVGDRLLAISDEAGDGFATTMLAEDALLPEAIRLERLPKKAGARLTVLVNGRELSAPLTHNQALLTEVLLDPPECGPEAGWVSDKAISETLWPDRPVMGREDVNRELKRLRQRLHDHGLTGYQWIRKHDTGGFTRFVLARGVEPEIEQGGLEPDAGRGR